MWHMSLGGLTTTPPPLASLSFRADLDTKPEITFCRKYLELPPSLPIYFVNYCLCADLKYYSIMSLPANQDHPPRGLLQWGSLPEVDSWGSEVSEVLLLSARSWITWTEPPVWLWQILTSRQAIVVNNREPELDSWWKIFPPSPQHYHKWPHQSRGTQIELSHVYSLLGDLTTFVPLTGHTYREKMKKYEFFPLDISRPGN